MVVVEAAVVQVVVAESNIIVTVVEVAHAVRFVIVIIRVAIGGDDITVVVQVASLSMIKSLLSLL